MTVLARSFSAIASSCVIKAASVGLKQYVCVCGKKSKMDLHCICVFV